MAKIDLLPEGAKETIQTGSAIGREFGSELLKRTTEFLEKDLQSYLLALKDSELIYERGVFPDSVYVFKHALVHDVVYQALLKSTRQRYHRKIAQVLEEGFPDAVEANPELLGHHFTEAGLVEPAIQYLQRAGGKAIKRSGNVEAIAYFKKGLELLKTLPDTPERSRKELMLHNALTSPLVVTRGYAATDVQLNYDRAIELSKQIGDTQQLYSVLMGSYVYNLVRADYRKALEFANTLLAIAHRLQDPPFFVGAHRALGTTFFWRGEFALAIEHFEKAINYYDPKQNDHFVTYLLGANLKLHCLLYWALILQWLGYPDQAAKKSQEALSFAQETSHPFSVAAALFFTSWFHYSRHEVPETKERADAAVNLSSKHGFPFWQNGGTMFLGWALAEQGKTEEGIAKIITGLAAWRDSGAEQFVPCALSLLAEIYSKTGKIEEGIILLEEAMALIDKTEERFWLPELYRLMGELMLSLTTNNNFQAERNFRQAIDIARYHHVKTMELRAAVSLGRLKCHQGKRESACELMTEIYDWFVEGVDTSDVKEAKALLEKLK
jgi:predicted ATPase